MGNEGVQLYEATLVDQTPDALPGCQLALAALDSLWLPTPMDRVVTTLAELVYQPLVGTGSARRPRRLARGAPTSRSRLGLGHLVIFVYLSAGQRPSAGPFSEIQGQ